MKKILVFLLVWTAGTVSFAQRSARQVVETGDVTRGYGATTAGIYNIRGTNSHNFFNFNFIGEFPDMVNSMFKSSAAIEGAWYYAFEKYVFFEVGLTYQVVGPTFNDTYVTAGVGWQAWKYYQPEFVFESQFIGGYTVKAALRNNIIVPAGGTLIRIFLDLGGAYLNPKVTADTDADTAALAETWTYYINLGVGILI